MLLCNDVLGYVTKESLVSLLGGVLQYTVQQGDTFSEGISLRDESYDGQGSKWDRRVDFDGEGDTGFKTQSSEPSPDPDIIDFSESNYGEGDAGPEILTGGLGQLTDTVEGANTFALDVGYGLGKSFPALRVIWHSTQ